VAEVEEALQTYRKARDAYRKTQTDKKKQAYRDAADALAKARSASRVTAENNGHRPELGAISPHTAAAAAAVDLN
jgi:collagenase-like PrtC family protease